MKTLKFVILSVLAIQAIYAQELDLAYLDLDELGNSTESTKSVSENLSVSHYVMNTYNNENPSIVKELEELVDNYNIKNHSVYDNSEKAIYRVVFKKEQSKIVVNYNSNGSILATNETYKNVIVPYSTRRNIAKQYPGWSIIKSNYFISYNRNGQIKKEYVIKIRKDKKVKHLVINR